jgi:hypothetical protein
VRIIKVKRINKFSVEKIGNLPVHPEDFHHTFKPPGNLAKNRQ